MPKKYKIFHKISQPQQENVTKDNSVDKIENQSINSISHIGENNKNTSKKNMTRRRWPRRILWIFAIFIAVVIVLRITLWVSLPWIINETIKGYDLQCSYERLSFSILTGDAELWHLVLKPADKNESLVYIEYCRAEVSIITLLSQQLVIPRIEIDGMDINITRASNGTFPQLERFLNTAQKNKKKTNAHVTEYAKEDIRQKEIVLSPPIKLDAMRFQNVQLNFRDESVSPILETRLDMNVRLSDLGSDKRKTRFQITTSSPPVLDQLVLEGTGSSSGMDLMADVRFVINGLHPKLIKNYLADLGISPDVDSIAFSCNGKLQTRGMESIIISEVKTSGVQTSAQKSHASPNPKILNIHSDLSDIFLTADRQESLFLERIAIDANIPASNSIHILSIEMVEGRANVWKDANNVFSAAGLRFINKPQKSSVIVADSNSLQAENKQVLTSQKQVQDFKCVLDKLLLGNLLLTFHDESVSPKTDLTFKLNNLELERITSKGVSSAERFGIQAKLGIPGVIGALNLEGTVDPFSPQKRAVLKLAAEEIRPNIADPYLKMLGIESLYTKGRFACDVNAVFQPQSNGNLTGEISVANIHLQDNNELFGLIAIEVQGISFDPNKKRTRIENVEISGQQLVIGRDENGYFDLLGFRLKGTQSQSLNIKTKENISASPPQTAPNDNAYNPLNSLPIIEVGQFLWHDNKLTFIDKAVSPAKSFNIADFGFQFENFVMDFSRDSASPAKLRAWVSAPGIAEKAELSGALSIRQAGLSLSLELTGKALSTAEITPYLRSLGIEMAIDNGGLRAGLNTDILLSKDGFNCSVNLRDAALWNNDANFIALKAMDVNNLRIQGGNIIIDKVELDQPYLTIAREQSGILNIAGIKILPKQASNRQIEQLSVTKKPQQATSGTGVTISDFSIKNSRLLWSDNAVEPALSQTMITNVTVSDFTFGADAKPSALNIDVKIPGIVQKFAVSGNLQLKTTEQAADLKLDVTGIQTEKLNPYFTNSLKPALIDATLKGDLSARIGQHGLGGNKISLEFSSVDYQNNSMQDPLLKIDSVKAVIDRLDPNAGIVAIKELSVHGLEAVGGQKTPDIFSVLGFDLSSGVSDSGSTKRIEYKTPGNEQYSTVQTLASEVNSPEKKQEAKSNKPKKSGQSPQITLDTLDLQISKFTLKNQTIPDIDPIVISDFQIHNKQPIKLFEDEKDANSIISIEITGKAQPLIESLIVKTETSLFTSKPRFQTNMELTKINTSKLTSLMPDLEKVINQNNLSSHFSGKADLTLGIDRKDFSGFDFSKPFGIDLVLKDIKYADSDNKKTLAGFDELNVSIPRIDLTKQSIHIKEIGLVNPQGTVSVENDGLHILGLTLKTSKKDAAEVNNIKVSESPGIAESVPAVKEAGISKGEIQDINMQKPELKIDQILVNGIDFVFIDKTSEPAMYLPLKGLDFELRGFTTARTANQMRFNAMLTAGEVPLPKKGKGNLTTAGDSNNLTASKQEPGTAGLSNIEQRLLFQEMSASGNLALYPKPNGWVKLGLSGMELVNFKGEAGKVGMTLNDGVLDTSIDLRFRKEGTFLTRTQIILTDLSLTEPPDGFLSKLLSLPVSLDTVLFILQDSGGAIKLPVSFNIGEKGISGGQAASAAIGATATLIANAVTNSPFRVAGTVTNILGIEEDKKHELETYVLHYAPGVTALSYDQLQKIDALLMQLKKNKRVVALIRHELGGGDILYAGSLVNPSNSDTVELLSKLRQDEADLYLERNRLASETKASFALGISNRTFEKIKVLQETERKIGLTERAIDDLLDRMRPGSEHAARTRTRDASLAIAKARLEEIAEILSTEGIPQMQERIRFNTPRYSDIQGDSGGNITITLNISKLP